MAAPEPSGLTVYKSSCAGPPALFNANAILLPSGDHAGLPMLPASPSISVSPLPSALATKRRTELPTDRVNAIFSPSGDHAAPRASPITAVLELPSASTM